MHEWESLSHVMIIFPSKKQLLITSNSMENGMESVEFRVPGNQLQKFENIFYTKDEWIHLEKM